ncbi:MAG: hypothetical protein V4454_14060 [Pseudomonadota bacterium]
MSSRGRYRCHATEFKIQLCQCIAGGTIGRRDAQKKYTLPANLIQRWPAQFERGELSGQEAKPKRLSLLGTKPRSLLNTRPGKTLGWRTAAEALKEYPESSQQASVATTG